MKVITKEHLFSDNQNPDKPVFPPKEPPSNPQPEKPTVVPDDPTRPPNDPKPDTAPPEIPKFDS